MNSFAEKSDKINNNVISASSLTQTTNPSLTISGTSTYNYQYVPFSQQYNLITTAVSSTAMDSISIETVRINAVLNLLMYIDENSLKDLLIKLKNDDLKQFKFAYSYLLLKRHFSEEFLLEFIEYTEKEDLLKMHASDILSESYKEIALFYKLKNQE